MSYSATHHYVTVLTPAGRAALATVAVRGPQASEIVDRYFLPVTPCRVAARPVVGVERPARPAGPARRCVASRPVGRILLGHWGHIGGEEVVVVRHSVDEVRVHCHGGEAASAAIVADLEAAGCESRAWASWIAAEVDDPVVIDARIALSRCRTQRTAGILLDQLHGALTAAVHAISTDIEQGRTDQACRQVRQLLDDAPLGLHLTAPWQVVLFGRPNVGKSSLINRMVGYQRAIVYEQPGTTRDVLTATTAIDGWPVELSDTAGMREGEDRVEMAGVEAARRQAAEADLRILVFDRSAPWSAADADLAARWPDAVMVHNKCDLPAHNGNRPVGQSISAITGEGLASLLATVAARLVRHVPPPGSAVPFTNEQVDHFATVLSALEEGQPIAAEPRRRSPSQNCQRLDS